MPGYLTQAKVLIDMVDWLTALENKLEPRIQRRTAQEIRQGSGVRPPDPIRDLETRMLWLARDARRLLRMETWDSAVPAPERPAEIKPTDLQEKAGEHHAGVGGFISKYAFTGSLGHDFPGAGYILAANQRWVYHTLHWGSPSHRWVRAGSTTFLFNALEAIEESAGRLGPAPTGTTNIVRQYINSLQAVLFGHCASIAAHVVLHPFIQNLVAATPNLDHLRLETALDAQIAIGYFQRESIKSGDSWTDYYLDEENDWRPALDLYLLVFNKTYDGPIPAGNVCELPGVPELKRRFPASGAVLDAVPALSKALTRYQGYGKLYEGIPPLEAGLARQQIESDTQKEFKKLLEEYRCSAPKLDRDYLEDGWLNTRRWAIDAGYDKGPAFFRWMWWFAIMGGGILVARRAVQSLDDFSTILEDITFGKFTHGQSEGIKNKYATIWREDGLGHERVLYVLIDSSKDGGGFGPINIFSAFSTLMSGLPVAYKGIFGQGRVDDETTAEAAFPIISASYQAITIFMAELWPEVTEEWWFRWLIKLPVDLSFDIFGAAVVDVPDVAKGKQGNQFDREMFHLQMMLWPFNFASCLLVVSIKSAFKKEDGSRETGYSFVDFLFSNFFPLIGASLLVFAFREFEKRILGVAGVFWPDDDRSLIDPYLRSVEQTNVGGRPRKLDGDNKVRVRLYADGQLIRPEGATNVVHPDDEAPKAYPPDSAGGTTFQGAEYTITQLFDRATFLAGILTMTAVKYNAESAEERKKTREIFDDWNLDHRTEAEWNKLMVTINAEPGLLEATEAWWKAVNEEREAEQNDINRLQRLFGVDETTSASQALSVILRYEDGSPMPDAEFEAVFGDYTVPGRTDSSGKATINAPLNHGDTYRLILRSWPEEQVVV